MSVATTTAGSLPRTAALLDANAARTFADDGFTLQSTPEFETLTAQAVADVVERQRATGITLVGDGEFGKAMTGAVDYGAWWSYSFQRVGGLSLTEVNAFNEPPVRSEPGNIRLTSFLDRRDRQLFPAVYAEAVETGRGATAFPTTTGPLAYRGQEAVASDIRHLTAALRPGEQGFLTAIAPGSAARVRNEFYATDEEHIFAWADALREEYRAIVDAGLILQLDDPSLAPEAAASLSSWESAPSVIEQLLSHPDGAVRERTARITPSRILSRIACQAGSAVPSSVASSVT